jgi:hypothetical protein
MIEAVFLDRQNGVRERHFVGFRVLGTVFVRSLIEIKIGGQDYDIRQIHNQGAGGSP